MKTIELKSITREVLNPREFLSLSDKDKENIRSTRIVPPQLGKSFGGVEVTFKTPKYSHR